jgi:hypothetical protein
LFLFACTCITSPASKPLKRFPRPDCFSRAWDDFTVYLFPVNNLVKDIVMDRNQKRVSVGGVMITFLVLLTAVALEEGFVSDPAWYNALYITIPLLVILRLIFHREASRSSTSKKGYTYHHSN